MTFEEAGQIILEGKRHIPCLHGGRVLAPDCQLCKAWGWVVNPEYTEACEILGIRSPLPRDVEEALKLDKYMKSKPEFYG